jgi:hypothetical protein
MGHRRGLEHLIKVDQDGIIKNFCIDIDAAGKTVDEIAQACTLTLSQLETYAIGSKCIALTGNSGGGGAVMWVWRWLVDHGFLDKASRYIHCLNHAVQKCLQRAIEASTGGQRYGYELLHSATLFCNEDVPRNN